MADREEAQVQGLVDGDDVEDIKESQVTAGDKKKKKKSNKKTTKSKDTDAAAAGDAEDSHPAVEQAAGVAHAPEQADKPSEDIHGSQPEAVTPATHGVVVSEPEPEPAAPGEPQSPTPVVDQSPEKAPAVEPAAPATPAVPEAAAAPSTPAAPAVASSPKQQPPAAEPVPAPEATPTSQTQDSEDADVATSSKVKAMTSKLSGNNLSGLDTPGAASAAGGAAPAQQKTAVAAVAAPVLSDHDMQNTTNALQLLKMGAFKLQPLVDQVPYEELIKMRLEDGIDPTCREDYLNEEDFNKVFGMGRETFKSLPAWKKQQKKKDVHLF